MPDRPKLGPGSGVIPGVAFFTEYQTAMKGLWDSSCLPLTGVAGTADDVEAVLDWPLDAGLIDGMKFTLTWAATNTGPVTLRLVWSGGNTAQIDVLTLAGDAMNPGTVEAGTRAMVEYISGSFRVLGGGGEGGAMAYYEALTASGDWTKPLGFLDYAVVIIELWGGGGGGGGGNRGGNANYVSHGHGGGGGGYNRAEFRYVDVPGTVPCVVGAGGAGGAGGPSNLTPGSPGTDGGATEFGTLLRATGGGGGDAGGDGAGNSTVLGIGGSPDFGFVPKETVPFWVGGDGPAFNTAPEGSIYGGGGGAGGGGGGGGVPSGGYNEGQSAWGGDGGGPVPPGGQNGADGHTPGGGGGGSRGVPSGNPTGVGGFGARGEIRIWIVG